MKHLFIILTIIFFNSYNAFTQNVNDYSILNREMQKNDTIPMSDTSIKIISEQIILENDFSFLIDEAKFYDCKVLNIYSYKNFNIIKLETKIEDKNVFADLVTIKNKNRKDNKIKVNSVYKIKLIRLYEKPLIRSIEYQPVYNIILGTEIFSILSTGITSFLFVSPNFDGLNYSSTFNFEEFEYFSRKKENETKEFICNFIRTITFKEDSALLLDYVDTVCLIKIINKFSFPFVFRNPDDKISNKQPFKLPKLNWKYLNIDESNFNSLFWGILDYYKIPFNKKNKIDIKLLCSNIRTKLLYSNEEVFTLRLNWNVINIDKNFESIISIKEKGNKFIVIGLTINPF